MICEIYWTKQNLLIGYELLISYRSSFTNDFMYRNDVLLYYVSYIRLDVSFVYLYCKDAERERKENTNLFYYFVRILIDPSTSPVQYDDWLLYRRKAYDITEIKLYLMCSHIDNNGYCLENKIFSLSIFSIFSIRNVIMISH
jgi:hypothetical protein